MTGMKWCNHCEREKALSEFYVNQRGNPQPNCKACHRLLSRLSWRRRQKDRARRYAEAERAWIRYWTNPDYRRSTIERAKLRDQLAKERRRILTATSAARRVA